MDNCTHVYKIPNEIELSSYKKIESDERKGSRYLDRKYVNPDMITNDKI